MKRAPYGSAWPENLPLAGSDPQIFAAVSNACQVKMAKGIEFSYRHGTMFGATRRQFTDLMKVVVFRRRRFLCVLKQPIPLLS